MRLSNIRNFVIISHIDHGKSTLADRFLEVTGTVSAEKLKPQYLDAMEVERERGITIKMAPVRMCYQLQGNKYFLNLIDTPGHSDFSYEVSRALAAVEGAVLLVDATQGIQAQTIANLRMAKEANLTIIGAVNKIDLNPPHLPETIQAVAELLGVSEDAILKISGKTGEGVAALLERIITCVPPPAPKGGGTKALIFDSFYDEHKGIIASVRVVHGSLQATTPLFLASSGQRCKVKEVGFFSPSLTRCTTLEEGTIGYLATGIKDPDLVRIGDTITDNPAAPPLPGYKPPLPVMFLSLYPDQDTDYEELKTALGKLRLNDAALSFQPETSPALGKGFKVGFLGKLHFEITMRRLEDEFHLSCITSFPSVAYRVQHQGTATTITQPKDFPEKPEKVYEPTIAIDIVTPEERLQNILSIANHYHLSVHAIENIGRQVRVRGTMPMEELLRDFDDALKSASSGFASFSYTQAAPAPVKATKLEILLNDEVVSSLTRIVREDELAREARRTVERLRELLPRRQVAQKIQARAHGRIIAREQIPALRKDVTGYLYGGDRTRKMKLWKKQKEGKKKLAKTVRVRIPPEVFRELLKKSR
ncbi:elongation factor 4 [Candidatus Parcubacteria bacterium]|nr:MAG: elongation factor 4 [Candidatus Parcubacteria bacterium]